MSELAKNAVSKSPIISQILWKKILEFFSHHQILGFKVCLELAMFLALKKWFQGQLSSSLQVFVHVSPWGTWNRGESVNWSRNVSLSWCRGLGWNKDLSRRNNESTKNSKCRNGSIVIIDRGFVSIVVDVMSGYLNWMGWLFLFFWTSQLICWVWIF